MALNSNGIQRMGYMDWGLGVWVGGCDYTWSLGRSDVGFIYMFLMVMDYERLCKCKFLKPPDVPKFPSMFPRNPSLNANPSI